MNIFKVQNISSNTFNDRNYETFTCGTLTALHRLNLLHKQAPLILNRVQQSKMKAFLIQ